MPAVLEIAWDAPAGGPENAPAIYVVEAGSGPAFAEIALVETGEAETRHAVPVANGTYYIRVRSRNDCGTSAASPEIEARVTGSVARGAPNPLVLLDTVNAVRERLGGTAFIRVMGQVRNGWLATSASFVEVTAIFDGPNGEASERASAYVNGRSRRLARSRLVTDTVLDAGGTGCFILFAEFPAFQITGVRFEVVADDRETEPLEGQVDVDGAVRQRADEFGDLMISGRMVNTGNRTTHFNEAWLDVRNTEGRVLDCDVAPVRGTESCAGRRYHHPGGPRAVSGRGIRNVDRDRVYARLSPSVLDQLGRGGGAGAGSVDGSLPHSESPVGSNAGR